MASMPDAFATQCRASGDATVVLARPARRLRSPRRAFSPANDKRSSRSGARPNGWPQQKLAECVGRGRRREFRRNGLVAARRGATDCRRDPARRRRHRPRRGRANRDRDAAHRCRRHWLCAAAWCRDAGISTGIRTRSWRAVFVRCRGLGRYRVRLPDRPRHPPARRNRASSRKHNRRRLSFRESQVEAAVSRGADAASVIIVAWPMPPSRNGSRERQAIERHARQTRQTGRQSPDIGRISAPRPACGVSSPCC